MVKQIILKYNLDGTVTTDVQGFHGQGCTDATQKLLASIGGQLQKQTLKPEYHETTKTAVTNRQC